MKTYYIGITAAFSFLLLSCSGAPEQVVDVTDEQISTESQPVFQRDEFDGTYSLFFQPDNGNVGDPMPFYDPIAEDFKVMYLQNDIPGKVRGVFHPIWGLETSDAATYNFLKELIPCGPAGSQDAAIGTGSSVYNPEDELYYNFYTGNKIGPQADENGQVIMMATSNDFIHWDKVADFIIKGNDFGYDRNDFRDPCVFKFEDGLWHMLVSTLNTQREGVVAEFVSKDLRTWEHNGVFMNMVGDRFYECPDIFNIGDWWYMIYSEKHADVRRVLYFKGKSLDEIKAQTANRNDGPLESDFFLDSRGFYAGKTASDGVDRYIWGWCPSRPKHDNTDVGIPPREPKWGGNLVAHKLIQHPDGSLTLGEIPAVAARFGKKGSSKILENTGKSKLGFIQIDNGEHVLYDSLTGNNYISLVVKTDSKDASFGISLCRDAESDKYYTIQVVPEEDGNYNIAFVEEGKEGKGVIKWIEGCSFAPADDLTYNISFVNENSVCVLYINDNACYTNRIYGIEGHGWSVNSYSSTIKVSKVSVSHFNE